jgi:chromosome segregation protein
MLKALELHGFKSFADKTRFEFPAGITVVVGPNGSGKSNIVDAIKWVLGEQSAKSLRGKEMSDVIFKGSGAAGRKPMNTAEATLVFDNAEKRLPIDAPEVYVTRRVYRSGEGEYLINRQPARLKDIRDLFRGSGVGGDAYSLIEQGKVDKLLQASAKDRRAIFEEAAGISRFKAKKVECQRRLERVEQNLLRLSDIVEEVENRLKTVRAQAGKARRYREYSERLQQLRTQVALVDWRRLTEQLEVIEADLATARDQTQAADAQAQRLEARQLELEAAALTAGEELRNCETQVAFARQQIAGHQAAIDHERTRSAELEEQTVQHGRNLLAMSDKAGDVRLRLKAIEAEMTAAQQAQQAAARELTQRQEHLADLARQQEAARREAESNRQQYLARLQQAATLSSQVETAHSRLAAIQQSIQQHERQLAELTNGETSLVDRLAAALSEEQSLTQQLTAHADRAEAAEDELAESRNLHASRSHDLAQLHGRQHGVAERAAMLEEFERTLEGIGAGVKEILAKAGFATQQRGNSEFRIQNSGNEASDHSTFCVPNSDFPWSLVRGVVADLLQAPVDHAGAIDVALGEMAQAIVVDGSDEQLQAITRAANVSGRVVLLSLNSAPTAPIELTAEMVVGVHVIARADKVTEAAEEHRPLVRRLLGRTFIVRTLDDALALRAKAPAGARFVTPDGELVDEHGAIAFGPRQSGTSLVSRRSQLRAARLDLAVLDQQIIDADRETAHLKREIQRHEQALRQLVEQGKSLDQQVAAAMASRQNFAQRIEQVREQIAASRQALDAASLESREVEAALRSATDELTRAAAAGEEMRQAIAQHDERQPRQKWNSHARSSAWKAFACDSPSLRRTAASASALSSKSSSSLLRLATGRPLHNLRRSPQRPQFHS